MTTRSQAVSKSGKISETVQDRYGLLQTINRNWYMAYGLSNRAIFDDHAWLSRSLGCCMPYWL